MELLIILIAITGYSCIIFEHKLQIDKAATALLTSLLCWAAYFALSPMGPDQKLATLYHNLGDVSQVIFYLMGAMLIVEVIDAHQGFRYLSSKIQFEKPLTAFCTTLAASFFLSSILDNLTTLIVMISLLKKMIPEREQRLLYSASAVFAVNAGGAWTPIGDITTTMLWIEGKITSLAIVHNLFIPSVVSLLIFGLLLAFQENIYRRTIAFFNHPFDSKDLPNGARTVLSTGIASLAAVPVLKGLIDFPPFMGVLTGVAILWIITDRMHGIAEDKKHLKVFHSLGRIDLSCVLFFLGVLLTVDALQAIRLFGTLSTFLETAFPSQAVVAYLVGLISAVIDNVPLVAAMIKLYDPATYPVNDAIWTLIAYCAGVGGSLLVIGSAPGVALMSLEKVTFNWYARKLFIPGVAAYTAGYLLCL